MRAVQADVDHWSELAKCAGEDTERWFPPREGGVYMEIAKGAKDICLGRDGRPPCPVKVECLLTALARNDQHGIYGGLSHRERNALVRRYSNNPKVAHMSLREFIEIGGRG